MTHKHDRRAKLTAGGDLDLRVVLELDDGDARSPSVRGEASEGGEGDAPILTGPAKAEAFAQKRASVPPIA
ncbi:MAG: hypothetical protein HUU21_03125 [Polyangiaceae bacterium]|nr:hypothetical protein [Polyangiaceae bacterium]